MPISLSAAEVPDGLLVTLTSSAEVPEKRAIVYVVDVSGSMNNDATVREGIGMVTTGMNILRLVCNSISASLATLGPRDEVAIVTFHTYAKVEMPFTAMTPENMCSARAILDGLVPLERTNMWGGISLALDLVAEHARV
ncbi:MAG: VWA domain-containing protein, partial [Actinomycetota bacterium]